WSSDVCSSDLIFRASFALSLPHSGRESAKEARKIRVVEVTDRTAKKDKQSRQCFINGSKPCLIARMQAVKLDRRKGASNGIPRGNKSGETYINGGKNRGAALAQLLTQQVHGLFAIAGTELCDAGYRSAANHVRCVTLEDAVFSPSEIIFRELTNLLEQLR